MPQPPASRLPDDHPAWKYLRPLGHELSRWLAAMTALQARWRKGRQPEVLTAFLARWMPQTTVARDVTEIRLALDADGGVSLSHTIAGADAGNDLAFSHPTWQALLHLPALRDFWTAELRASHHAHLLQVIPHAWCMDPTPLPPGSVIAGLGITSWDGLERIESARRFTRHPVGEGNTVLVANPVPVAFIHASYTHRDGQIILQDAHLNT